MLTHIVFSLLATDKSSIGFIANTFKHFQPIDPAGAMDEDAKNWLVCGPFNMAVHIDKVHVKEENIRLRRTSGTTRQFSPPADQRRLRVNELRRGRNRDI